MLKYVRELLFSISGNIQIFDRPHRIQIIRTTLFKCHLYLFIRKNCFIHLILKRCHIAEIKVPLWKPIALTGIQSTFHRYEIPKFIIGNERPRYKVIEITLPNVDLVTRINVVNRRRKHICHFFPELLGI